jgi:hypothetical protein
MAKTNKRKKQLGTNTVGEGEQEGLADSCMVAELLVDPG